MYRFFLPAVPLRPYIENYWILRSQIPTHAPLRESIFVDGKADVIFNFGAAYQRLMPTDQPQTIAMSNVDGQRIMPVSILQIGAVDLVGVRFKPGGLAPFLPLPVHELSNEVASVGDVFGSAGDMLEGRLYESRAYPEQQAEMLDQFFRARLHPDSLYGLVQAMLGHLSHPESPPIHSMSRHFGYSIRSIDRFFKQTFGFSPKMIVRVVRLGRALHFLSHEPTLSLTEIAFRIGYYDQAHFTHDFKAFTGHTPSAYRAMLSQRRDQPPPNLVQFLQDPPSPKNYTSPIT